MLGATITYRFGLTPLGEALLPWILGGFLAFMIVGVGLIIKEALDSK